MGPKEMMLGVATTLLLTASTGCAPGEKPTEGTAEIAAFVVPALPESAHRTMIDFGGKVHIVGYEVSPEGAVGPSQSVSLNLYWRRVGALEPGWVPFTHLESDLGTQLGNFDRQGEFRGKIAGHPDGLALLDFGKIYKDGLAVGVPKASEITPRVSLLVGVFNQKVYDETDRRQNVRLPVVSGSTSGHDAALIASFSTGVERQRPVALKGSKP
jgi:hypothetical protein